MHTRNPWEGLEAGSQSLSTFPPQLASVLATPGLQDYLLHCGAASRAPRLTPFLAWALRHEYHLQYLVLTLAQRTVGFSPLFFPLSYLHFTYGFNLPATSAYFPVSIGPSC